jgi:hypothetical protein
MSLVQINVFKTVKRKHVFQGSIVLTGEGVVEMLCDSDSSTAPESRVIRAINKSIGSVTKITVDDELFILTPLLK